MVPTIAPELLRALFPLRLPHTYYQWMHTLLTYKTPQQVYIETYLKTFIEVIR